MVGLSFRFDLKRGYGAQRRSSKRRSFKLPSDVLHKWQLKFRWLSSRRLAEVFEDSLDRNLVANWSFHWLPINFPPQRVRPVSQQMKELCAEVTSKFKAFKLPEERNQRLRFVRMLTQCELWELNAGLTAEEEKLAVDPIIIVPSTPQLQEDRTILGLMQLGRCEFTKQPTQPLDVSDKAVVDFIHDSMAQEHRGKTVMAVQLWESMPDDVKCHWVWAEDPKIKPDQRRFPSPDPQVSAALLKYLVSPAGSQDAKDAIEELEEDDMVQDVAECTLSTSDEGRKEAEKRVMEAFERAAGVRCRGVCGPGSCAAFTTNDTGMCDSCEFACEPHQPSEAGSDTESETVMVHSCEGDEALSAFCSACTYAHH